MLPSCARGKIAFKGEALCLTGILPPLHLMEKPEWLACLHSCDPDRVWCPWMKDVAPDELDRHWGFFLQPQPPHTRQKYEQKRGPQNCRICLVLKHLGSYFVQMFVHIFALYVGAGVTSLFLRHGEKIIDQSWLSAGWLEASDNWKATKEYLNQRGTKIRVSRVCFRTPFLPPFSPRFSPSFPFRPCAFSHHFSPLHLPLHPPFCGSRKSPI